LAAYLLYSVVTDTLIIGAGTYFWLKGWPF
jgi:hypothetical protein